jgi:membrane-associated phospholipid phosphatase
VSTVSRAQDTVIECDSALILPPDTNAVVSGCDADTMFSVAEYKDPTHRVRPAEWIVPSVAAVGGALCVKTAWGKQFRHWTQKNLSRHGEKKVWADNYMPYIPAAAVYALDLCGVKAQHRFLDRTIILGMSAVTMVAVTKGAKMAFKESRPDGNGKDAFPSGHTAISFMCAEFLWQEYRASKPWIGYTGYALAAGVAYLRVHNNRHWVSDVVAGAAVGMLSTKFAYWLYPKLFKEHKRGVKKAVAFGAPYYNGKEAGLNFALLF